MKGMRTRTRIILMCFAAMMMMAALPLDVLASGNTDGKGGRPAERDRLTDISNKEEQKPMAAFNGIENAMRICATQPQRLLPSQGSAPEKASARSLSSRNTILLCNFQNYCLRQESAPFRSPVSREYYVIALRHIIC